GEWVAVTVAEMCSKVVTDANPTPDHLNWVIRLQAAEQVRIQLGTRASIWSASVLSGSPMSIPCASISITTLALETIARSLLKPGRLPRIDFCRIITVPFAPVSPTSSVIVLPSPAAVPGLPAQPRQSPIICDTKEVAAEVFSNVDIV